MERRVRTRSDRWCVYKAAHGEWFSGAVDKSESRLFSEWKEAFEWAQQRALVRCVRDRPNFNRHSGAKAENARLRATVLRQSDAIKRIHVEARTAGFREAADLIEHCDTVRGSRKTAGILADILRDHAGALELGHSDG